MKDYGKECVCQNVELEEINVEETLVNIRELTEYTLKESFSVKYFSSIDGEGLKAMQNIFKAYDGFEDVIKSYTDHVNDMYQRQIRIEEKVDRLIAKLDRIENKLNK